MAENAGNTTNLHGALMAIINENSDSISAVLQIESAEKVIVVLGMATNHSL